MIRFEPDAALPRIVSKTAVTTPLPTDALIDIHVRRQLDRFIPIWLNVGTLDTIAHLRIARALQRRPACWCDARRLCIHPDVLQHLPDVGDVGDERDDAHLPATQRAQQRDTSQMRAISTALAVGVAAGLAVLLGATVDPLKLARRRGVHTTLHGHQQQRTLGVAGL